MRLIALIFLLTIAVTCLGQGNFYNAEYVSKVDKISYLISLPDGYEDSSSKEHPLILFMHGGDGSNTKHHPKMYAMKERLDFPFVVVAPSCNSGCSWGNVNFKALLSEVAERYRVDLNRIYVTGYSMGGYGTWAALIKFPDLFAAAAPICGGGDPTKICTARRVAIKAYHAKDDNVTPYSSSLVMIEALKKCAADATLKTAITGGHGIWPSVYSDAEFYAWLLKHTK